MKTASFIFAALTLIFLMVVKALDLESETSLLRKKKGKKNKRNKDKNNEDGNEEETTPTLFSYEDICNEVSQFTDCSEIDTDKDGMIS